VPPSRGRGDEASGVKAGPGLLLCWRVTQVLEVIAGCSRGSLPSQGSRRLVKFRARKVGGYVSLFRAFPALPQGVLGSGDLSRLGPIDPVTRHAASFNTP
jgi:hypothetical protein